VRADQLSALVSGAILAAGQARQKQGGHAPPAPTIPIESWTTVQEEKALILILNVRGGVELRFALTPTTVRGGETS
jgi:hypothetical protein